MPTSGPATGGARVAIQGTNFDPGSTTVTFGGNPATNVTCPNAKACGVTTPPGSGTVSVVLSTPVASATAPQQYTYTPTAPSGTPSITSIMPTSGPAAGGARVAIQGTNFVTGSTTVTFGGVPATDVSCPLSTACGVTTPPGSGTVSVVLTTPAGSVTAPQHYSYTPVALAPVINGIYPPSGGMGTQVTITGSNFVPGGTTVHFDGTQFAAICGGTTSCAMTVPALQIAPTSVSVSVTTAAGTSNAVAFYYTGGGTVMLLAQIQPSMGPVGTSVTFIGSGFPVGPATAIFGTVSAPAYCSAPSYCTAIAPAQPYGAITVQVSLRSYLATSNALVFAYTGGGMGMVLSQIQPGMGPAGTSVTLTGSGFPTGSVTATFGTVSTSAYCNTSTQCTAVAPAQPYGTTSVPVQLQSYGGTSNAVTFTYTATSPITSINLNGIGTVQGSVGQPIGFTASVAAGSIAPYDTVFTWYFGDGTSATGQSVQHTYYAPGTYTVSLSARSAAYGANGSASGTAVIVASAPPPSNTAVAGAASGPLVGYQAGWNLVGGPSGTAFPQAAGPIYIYLPSTGGYQAMPNTTGVSGGQGYWAYFAAPTSVALSGSGPSLPLSLSAPAGQYIVVGNPSATQAVTVTGADVIYTFDCTTNRYVLVGAQTTLAPGQAAWVYSFDGGVITLR